MALDAALYRMKGIHLRAFIADIRCYYVQAQVHGVRLAYQEVIATRFLRMSPQYIDSTTVWNKVADARNVRPKLGQQWKSGLTDADIDEARRYWLTICDEADLPKTVDPGDLANARIGIARTLMFIAVYPPKERCRPRRRHARRIPRILEAAPAAPVLPAEETSSQSARPGFDQTILTPAYWIQPAFIEVYQEGDGYAACDGGETGEPYLLPWLILKFVTTADIRPIVRKKRNENIWMWDDDFPVYKALWRVEQ